jgi:hypothetical protein
VQPSLAVTLCFVAIVLVLFAAVVAAAGRAGRARREDLETTARSMLTTSLGLAAWLAFTTYLAARGWLLDFESMPPPFLVLMAPTAAATVVLAFSRFGSRLVLGLGFPALVGFQVFRIPVEMVLFELHREGVIPEQMTFAGRNFDVLSGLTALVVAVVAMRRPLARWVLAAWNVAGLALLANIVGVAVLSAPFPFRAFHEPPANTLVMHAPWVWLPTFLVQAAFFGHLLVFRKLVGERRASS